MVAAGAGWKVVAGMVSGQAMARRSQVSSVIVVAAVVLAEEATQAVLARVFA